MSEEEQKKLNERLIRAAEQGNVQEIQSALAAGADIETTDVENDTPLIIAIKFGHSDACMLLIEAGADVQAMDNFYYSALYHALHDRHYDVSLKLIEKGADVNGWDYSGPGRGGKPLLLWAAEANRKEAGEFLLRAGATERSHRNIKAWVKELGDSAKKLFSAHLLLGEWKCLADGKLRDEVLDTCVIDKFDSLIGARLIAAKQYELFEKVWDALPDCWKEKNQGIYIEYAKHQKKITLPAAHLPDEGRVMR